MMRHEFYVDGVLVRVEETPDVYDPLNAEGVIATLNAVLGLWTVEDAANAVGLTPADLIAEAQAWALAQGD
jgi:hypothetical protein